MRIPEMGCRRRGVGERTGEGQGSASARALTRHGLQPSETPQTARAQTPPIHQWTHWRIMGSSARGPAPSPPPSLRHTAGRSTRGRGRLTAGKMVCHSWLGIAWHPTLSIVAIDNKTLPCSIGPSSSSLQTMITASTSTVSCMPGDVDRAYHRITSTSQHPIKHEHLVEHITRRVGWHGGQKGARKGPK